MLAQQLKVLWGVRQMDRKTFETSIGPVRPLQHGSAAPDGPSLQVVGLGRPRFAWRPHQDHEALRLVLHCPGTVTAVTDRLGRPGLGFSTIGPILQFWEMSK